MGNAKKTTISDGNLVVYIWFWGGLITSFISNAFVDLLEKIFPNQNEMVYLVPMFIFDALIIYLVIKYMMSWLRKKYEMGDKKKLFKPIFETFIAWSLLGMGFMYWELSPVEKTNIPLLVLYVFGWVIELLVLYVALNRYLRIKYYK